MSNTKDQGLIKECCEGRNRSVELFIREYSGLIYYIVKKTFLIRMVPFTPQDIEDIHHSIFVELFKNDCAKLKQFKGLNGCSFAAWLKVVCINYTLNCFRKKGPDGYFEQHRQLAFKDIDDVDLQSDNILSLMERKEQKALIEKAVSKLTPRERLFFKFHYEQEISMSQLPDIMNVPPQTLYSIKHRFIQKLKKAVKKELEGDRSMIDCPKQY